MADAPRRSPLLIVVGALVVVGAIVAYLVLGRDNHAAPREASSAPPVAVRDAAPAEDRPVVTVVKRPADRPRSPDEAPEVAKRADGRVLPPALVAELGAPIKTAIRACATSVPEEHRVGSRMKGIVKVTVAGGSATISTADLSLVGVPEGDAAKATLDCLQKSVVGTAAPTAEAAVSDYEISMSLLLFPGATGVARPGVSTGSIQ